MSRKTNLDLVLFDVEEQLIYRRVGNQGQLTLGDFDAEGTFDRIPRFRAIVDVERNHVFAVVAEDYALVPNSVALDLGKQCFAAVFGAKALETMKLFNIRVPRTRSFCHVDYVYEGGKIEPSAGDSWLPFLRITNSYNRTYLLRFDLGFCREICTNGVVFGRQTISYHYPHTLTALASSAKFSTSFGRWADLSSAFLESLHNLKRYHVPKKHMFPLVCYVFGIQFTAADLGKPRRLQQLHEIHSHVVSLANRYCEELSETGYAALNVLTDFASRPSGVFSADTVVDSLQKKCSAWIDEFPTAMKDDAFSWEKYLGSYHAQMSLLFSK